MESRLARIMRPGPTVAAGILAVAITASACSSPGGSSAPAGSTGGGQSTSTQSSGSGSGASATSAADKSVATYEQRPTTIGITSPVKGSIPSNITVAVMNTGQPSGNQFNKGTQQAIAAMGRGWRYVNVDQGVTPQSISAAWNQVIRMRPSIVIADGITRSVVQTQCNQLRSMHIAVLDAAVTDDNLGSCVTGIVYGPKLWEGLGAAMADWIIKDSNGTADVVGVAGQEFGILNSVVTGVQNELKAKCPGCSYTKLDVEAAGIGTTVPGQLVGYIRSHSSVHYIAAAYCDLLLGVPAAFQAAGLTSVKLVGQNPQPSDQTTIAAGGLEKAAVSYGPENLSWTAVDAVARYFAHDNSYKTLDYDPPLRGWLLTSDNVSSWGGKPSDLWPNIANYQNQYKKLWTSQ